MIADGIATCNDAVVDGPFNGAGHGDVGNESVYQRAVAGKYLMETSGWGICVKGQLNDRIGNTSVIANSRRTDLYPCAGR